MAMFVPSPSYITSPQDLERASILPRLTKLQHHHPALVFLPLFLLIAAP